MSGLSDTFKPVNVAEEKDELGRPINRLEEEMNALRAAPVTQAAPVDDFMSTLRSAQPSSEEPQVDDFMSTLRSAQEPSGEPQVDDFMSTLKGAQVPAQTGGYASSGPGIQYSGFAAADEVLQSFEAGSLTKGPSCQSPNANWPRVQVR